MAQYKATDNSIFARGADGDAVIVPKVPKPCLKADVRCSYPIRQENPLWEQYFP